jgi:cytochrome c oxidase assembly protein subunit 15
MSKSADFARRTLSPASAFLLFSQSAIVVTGGAVRLTSSGLGCPTWPECVPGSYTPVPNQAEGQFHAWIEFGNRLLTFILVLSALITLIAVLKSGRRDLRLLAVGQFLGIFAQGVLGGVTVLTNLNPFAVASHYLLSTILIAASVSLYTRRHIPFIKKTSHRQSDLFSRWHVVVAFMVVVLGTILTGAGPHAGDVDAPRIDLRIQTAALMHGLAVILLLLITVAFFRADKTGRETKELLVKFFLISIAQGGIGFIQYLQGVPEFLVAIHLVGAVLVWIGAWRIWLSVQRQEMDTAR